VNEEINYSEFIAATLDKKVVSQWGAALANV